MSTQTAATSTATSEWIGNDVQMDAILLFFGRIALRKHGPTTQKGAVLIPGLTTPSDMQDTPEIGGASTGRIARISRRALAMNVTPPRPLERVSYDTAEA